MEDEKKLTSEDLEHLSGGWKLTDLTKEELAHYYHLDDMVSQAHAKGNKELQKKYRKLQQELEKTFEEKYGPGYEWSNPWDNQNQN